VSCGAVRLVFGEDEGVGRLVVGGGSFGVVVGALLVARRERARSQDRHPLLQRRAQALLRRGVHPVQRTTPQRREKNRSKYKYLYHDIKINNNNTYNNMAQNVL
jgi:hypothetical protein